MRETAFEANDSNNPPPPIPLSASLHLTRAEATRTAGWDRLAVLRDDQRRRWARGDRMPVEGYLELLPALARQPEALVDLIYSEFLLREELGEHPTCAEYEQRFPA